MLPSTVALSRAFSSPPDSPPAAEREPAIDSSDGPDLPDALIVTGNTAHTRPENRAFFPALDGLRALAFLMVFLQHYFFLPWGWTGVNVFFVLSGFLITGILFDSRDDPHRARNFYVRRTLRIFPLFYGVFALLLLLEPVMHWRWSLAWIAWPLYLGNFLRFVSPQAALTESPGERAANGHLSSRLLPKSELYLGHFWSLCVEEQFYLAWPWLVFFIRSRRALIWLTGLTVVAVTLARVLGQHLLPAWMIDQEILQRATPFQLDALMLGALLALLWRGPHRDLLLRIGRVVCAVAALATVAFLALSVAWAQPHPFFNYVYPPWRYTFGISFVDIFSAAVILCCLTPGGLIARTLTLRPLRWIGRISYGAYVLHDILHDLWDHIAVHLGRHSTFLADHVSFTRGLLAFLSTLLLAFLSFRFFESPFLNLKERWTIRSAR